MTFEARLGFIVIFLLIWATIGVIPWALAAIRSKGRGALLLLPVVIFSAVLGGIIVPLTGARGITGFWTSLFTALGAALVAAAAGSALMARVLPAKDDETRVRRPLRPRRAAEADDPPATPDA